MINRFAFVALKAILCHFPGGGGGSGRRSFDKKKKDEEESRVGGGEMEVDIRQCRDVKERVEWKRGGEIVFI